MDSGSMSGGSNPSRCALFLRVIRKTCLREYRLGKRGNNYEGTGYEEGF